MGQLQQQRKGNGGVEEKSWDLPKNYPSCVFSRHFPKKF